MVRIEMQTQKNFKPRIFLGWSSRGDPGEGKTTDDNKNERRTGRVRCLQSISTRLPHLLLQQQ